MLSSRYADKTSVAAIPTLGLNLLPLVGIFALGWRVAELLAVYWLEIGTSLVVYGIAALFAELPVVVEGRKFCLPGVKSAEHVGVPSDYERPARWDRDPEPVELPGSLPPIYPRNGWLVVLSVGMGSVWLGGFLLRYPGLVATLASPAIALTATGTVLADCQQLYREYFAGRQYEEMSAHMVLEIPGRLLFFAALYVLGLSTLGLLSYAGLVVLVEATTGMAVPRVPAELLFGVAMVLGRSAVAWSRFRAETATNPSGFATWFVPEDPRD